MYMTREDLAHLRALGIDLSALGLEQGGIELNAYFCTPVGAEPVGAIGCDGVHFVLLPGDERVFCVDPSMGEIGTFVLPVGEDLRQFLSFVLYCRDANPISQIWWMNEKQFRDLLREDAEASWPGSEAFFAKRDAALSAVAAAFCLAPEDPFEKVKAMQAAFDPSVLSFSAEYYDVLGLEPPEGVELPDHTPGPEDTVTFKVEICGGEDKQ